MQQHARVECPMQVSLLCIPEKMTAHTGEAKGRQTRVTRAMRPAHSNTHTAAPFLCSPLTRLCRVEAARDDVLGVLERQRVRALEREVLPQEPAQGRGHGHGPSLPAGATGPLSLSSACHALLVVRELDDERDVEGLLEPLRELEGDEVPEVQRLGRRAAPRVQVERLAPLVCVEQRREVAMREEEAAPQEAVRAAARQALHASDRLVRDALAPEVLTWQREEGQPRCVLLPLPRTLPARPTLINFS